MICVNELTAMRCRNRSILSELVVCLAPFAPHIAEELWHALGNETSVCDATWPGWNEEYLKEDAFPYAISFNGKSRFVIEFAADATREEIEQAVLAHPNAQKWLEGKKAKKVIIVPGKIVNVVL
jgi:leucyl-tRNA synthetase